MRPTHCVILALAGLLLGAAGHAYEAPPDHGCSAPSRPADEAHDRRWQAFLDDVDAYRACISSYMERQQQAAIAHRQAARAAADEWNHFVRNEMNVPSDFPWPPPDRP